MEEAAFAVPESSLFVRLAEEERVTERLIFSAKRRMSEGRRPCGEAEEELRCFRIPFEVDLERWRLRRMFCGAFSVRKLCASTEPAKLMERERRLVWAEAEVERSFREVLRLCRREDETDFPDFVDDVERPRPAAPLPDEERPLEPL